MEDALVALERRGINLKAHAQRMDAETKRLPFFLLTVGKDTFWFHGREALDTHIQQNNIKLDGQGKDGLVDTTGDGVLAHYVELHEVKSINSGLKELAELGFGVQDLIPEQRTGSTESKFHLHREENRIGIDDLRSLLPAVRSAGERGMQLTRFKGLGEMNPEELRETTLDRDNRTLVKVTLTDAAAADEMFRVLRGDKVEPRRQFIEKHALEVRNLDV
jgi:DNA gyrase subunit B